MNTSSQILKENINPIYKNLYLYVPRASLRTTENQVKDQFFRCQIGTVEYCDLVIIKDKDTKQPLYAQLFIKLACWDLLSHAKSDFERNGSIKLFLTGTEFWIILPNNNPLPRTHVNTSQLAASTEKLFEQSEAMEKKMTSFEDEMRAEMAEMRAFMKLQQEKIDALEFKLAVQELAKEVEEEPCPYDAELDALLEEQVVQLPKLSRTASMVDPLDIPVIKRESAVKPKVNDEDACIFSLNKIPRNLSPVPIISSRTEPPLSLVDIVLQNPEKALASRDFCGNS
jgi:hypothetical protein